MSIRCSVAALLLAGTGCATTRTAATSLPPLGAQAEVHVYALPLPPDADHLSFTVEGVSLRRPEGGVVALEFQQAEVVGAGRRGQLPLAWGRVPAGDYAGLEIRIRAANVVRGSESARLLVEPEPARVELAFRVGAGAAAVVWLALDPAAVRAAYAFAPGFKATLAPQTPPAVALYCTNTASASVTAADRRARLVTGVVPVGAQPKGIALDRAASRAYVALSRADQIEVLDAAANASVGRIPLMPGDGPGEVRLAADGTILVANVRSRTLSFVDPAAMAEVGRVPVGDEPSFLLVDRAGRRAYVANRGSATVTVVDVATRAVVGTVSTDPEPLRLALSRDGTRLYVVHRGSAYLAVYALPSLVPQARAYVGLGAYAVKVDARTDLVYLSRVGERRISVYDPISLQPLDRFDVPGEVSQMAIDDAENTLLALVPGRRAVAVFDLTSRRLLAEIPVGLEPYGLALAGERF